MQPIFTVIGTPDWANGGAGLEHGSDEDRPTCSRSSTAAARRYSGTYKGRRRRRSIGRVRKWIAWNEPNNPVFLKPQFVRSGAKWVMQSAKDYARICNAVVKAVKIGATVQQGRLRRHLAAGQQPAGNAALVRVAARLPARDEARRRDRASTPTPTTRTTATRPRRRNTKPPLGKRGAAADGRHARQLRAC